jgi:hypothetical protein
VTKALKATLEIINSRDNMKFITTKWKRVFEVMKINENYNHKMKMDI